MRTFDVQKNKAKYADCTHAALYLYISIALYPASYIALFCLSRSLSLASFEIHKI